MITTARNRYIGGHVTDEVVEALDSEAEKCHVSVSQLIFLLLRDSLKSRGHDLGYEYKIESERGGS